MPCSHRGNFLESEPCFCFRTKAHYLPPGLPTGNNRLKSRVNSLLYIEAKAVVRDPALHFHANRGEIASL